MTASKDRSCNLKSSKIIERLKATGMLKLHKRYVKVLKAFRDRVVKELGGQIQSIVIYGSAARGEAREDSDIDVMIVGRNKDDRIRVSEIGYDVDYENNFYTLITPLYYTEEEFEHRVRVGSPFIYEVLRDGVILYDDGTFNSIREKMLRAGR